MTTLPPLEQREAAGVNTVRRAIAYALHLLRSVSDAVEIVRDTRLVDDQIEATFKGRVTFNYDVSEYYRNGSNPLRGVIKLSEETLNHSFGNIGFGIGYQLPPTLPEEVDSLEKFLLWATQLLSLAESQLIPPKLDALKLTQGKNTAGFYIRYEYSFPFDFSVYAAHGNLIEAVDYNNLVGGNGAIDNTTIINNAFLVGN